MHKQDSWESYKVWPEFLQILDENVARIRDRGGRSHQGEVSLQPQPQGTAVGVFGSFEDFGLLISPILISAAYATYGANSIFLAVGAVALAGLLFSLVFRKADSRTSQLVEAFSAKPA